MAEGKSAALSEAIAKAVGVYMNPQFADMKQSLATILARLDLAESVAAPKRATRAAKPAAKGAASKSAGGTKSEEEKVTNALLYFRYALKNDLDGFRTTYADEDAIEGVIGEAPVAKKLATREKEPGEFYSTAGAAIWKKFSDETKKDIRAQFDAWKQNKDRDGDAPPLEEDGEAGAEDEAEA